MRTRTSALTLPGLLLVVLCHAEALAQAQPPECTEAMAQRSPQAQVELFTRCLDTGRLGGGTKATTYKQRAVAYMHLGQHQRAIDDINAAMRLNSGDADNYYLRAVAYRGLNQHQQAIEDCGRAIGLDPRFAAAYATRAYSHKALGNTGQGRADARRAQELDPSVRVPTF